MIEETIQGIIVTVVAIAPVLYIFLRRWVARHRSRQTSRTTDRDRRDAFGRRESGGEPATDRRSEAATPRRGLARLFRRAGRSKIGRSETGRSRTGRLPPLPPRENREPQPIFDRLRPKQTPASEAGRRSQALANWSSPFAGESGDSVESGTQSASPAVGGQPAAAAAGSTTARQRRARVREYSAQAWRRIDRLSGLKRAIVLREILGPPRAIGRYDEPPGPW